MIRKLTEKDNPDVIEFLREEPSINLFMLGDIESFGYDENFQELWGDFSTSRELRGVLLRFYTNFIPYVTQGADIAGFTQLMKENPHFQGLSGKAEMVAYFEEALSGRLGKKQLTYFAECTKASFVSIEEGIEQVKLAELDDIGAVLELRETIAEFIPNPNAKEMLINSIKSGTGRNYFLERDGEMVALASTTAENSLSAMIVGVCTRDDYRNQGLATIVLNRLMVDMFALDKVLCLFYDNPKAGSIYKRLGFKQIGMWTMYR